MRCEPHALLPDGRSLFRRWSVFRLPTLQGSDLAGQCPTRTSSPAGNVESGLEPVALSGGMRGAVGVASAGPCFNAFERSRQRLLTLFGRPLGTTRPSAKNHPAGTRARGCLVTP